MSLIIDASVAIAWAVPDKTNSYADAAMEAGISEGIVVPSLWFLEVGNILVINNRRGRLSQEEVNGIVENFGSLSLISDPETATRAMFETVEIAQRHQLSVYDAAYLELASREGFKLATLDQNLASAARGLKLLYKQ